MNCFKQAQMFSPFGCFLKQGSMYMDPFLILHYRFFFFFQWNRWCKMLWIYNTLIASSSHCAWEQLQKMNECKLWFVYYLQEQGILHIQDVIEGHGKQLASMTGMRAGQSNSLPVGGISRHTSRMFYDRFSNITRGQKK